ncbi:MAG: chemotaxis protein CheW [Prochloraceae cyanobacterium]|nr:chemotaxis protein CheW [Prochloraceae cyanobacterium]
MIQEYFGIELFGSVRIALPLQDLETIERFGRSQICSIPGVAAFFLGIIHQRGSLTWVLDGDRFLDLQTPETCQQSQSQVIVVIIKHQLGNTQKRVAWCVKNLEGVLSLNLTQSQPRPDLLPERFQSLFTAVVQHNNQPIFILDSEAFFKAIGSRTHTLVGV